VDRYFAGSPTLSGLILGYGAASLTQVRRAASELGPLLNRLLLSGHPLKRASAQAGIASASARVSGDGSSRR